MNQPTGTTEIIDNSIRKQRIRERYKGISEDNLDFIPAIPQEDFYRSEARKRVAVYARVSTDDPRQTSSYELQKNYYEDMVNKKDNWDLVDIYADEGISGTSLQHRDSFLRMIEDCKAGNIDMIVTKSVSRFARNIIDCIGYVRELKNAPHPVGVFFETENIYTLNDNSEMALSFIATLAQEESHTKSEIMNSSIEMRFKRGIFLTPVLLGYDHDTNGNLIINEEEARTVRIIFFAYLYGYTVRQIAEILTDLKRPTKLGNTVWAPNSVYQLLINERYCGDVLARKSYTPNYLDHKSRKNKHNRNQYRQKNHHEAIISREDFFAVQKMIRFAKYGNKGYYPELKVIKTGTLAGFVTVHPKWAAFTEDDYYYASEMVTDETSQLQADPIVLNIGRGSVDLSGYELVRGSYISSAGHIEATFVNDRIIFNLASVKKMPDVRKIELLVMPHKRLLAVRPSDENSRYGVIWSKRRNDGVHPGIIFAKAYITTLYRIFGWNEGSEYKILGSFRNNSEDRFLLFDMSEAVSIRRERYTDTPDGIGVKHRRAKGVREYPEKWEGSFGEKYYSARVDEERARRESDMPGWSENVVCNLGDEGVTSAEEARKQMNRIIGEIADGDTRS